MTTQTVVRAAIALTWLVIAIGNVGFAIANQEEDHYGSMEEEQVNMTVEFVNELPDDTIELFWENHDVPDDHPDRRRTEGVISPRGGSLSVNTFFGHGAFSSQIQFIFCFRSLRFGHRFMVDENCFTALSPNFNCSLEFSYELNDIRHYVTPPSPNSLGQQYLILAGDAEGFRVRCELTTHSQQSHENLDIIVKPYWAPRGASRFLDLVRRGYYDGVALHRVVPEFLTQFGIAKDYDTRTEWRENTILDDFPPDVKFEPGFVSFAGRDPDSRTTEIFIVMPGASEEQLNYFGENSWETPFAVVDGDVNDSALTRIYSAYGDIDPWGSGEFR